MTGAPNSDRTRVLVIDDDPMAKAIVRQSLDGISCDIQAEMTGASGIERTLAESPDVMVLDHVLPDTTGIEVLKELQHRGAITPVIFVTAKRLGSIAIEAMKLGAFDYLTKPLDLPRLRRQVEQAIELNEALHTPAEELAAVKRTASRVDDFELVGECPAMQTVFKAIGKVASRDVSVLIRGEQGTGKESVARAIHLHSRRSRHPFVKLHCPSHEPSELERILFGSVDDTVGKSKPGRLQEAAGGTLLLQEIGTLPLPLQGKLLNFIREGCASSDVAEELPEMPCRIIASSCQDLERLVRDGKLRSDLYYQLSSFVIQLPPLRMRRDDLPLLIEHLLPTFDTELDGDAARPIITSDALHLLCRHTWPGNIDELHSVLRQAVVESKGNILLLECLTEAIGRDPVVALEDESQPGHMTQWDRFADLRIDAGVEDLYEQAILEVDRKLITRVLQRTAGNQAHAARVLGMTRASLRKKLRRLGLVVQQIVESSDTATISNLVSDDEA